MRKLILMMLLATLGVIPTMGDYIAIHDGGVHVIGDDRYKDDHIRLDHEIANDPGTSFTLNTGGIIGGGLVTYNSSTAIIDGGTVGEKIVASGVSEVEIKSGTIQGYVYSGTDSIIEIIGGTISGDIKVHYQGNIKVSGGLIGGIFDVWGDGVIELYGSDFSVGGVDLSVGDSLRDYGTLELLGFGDPFYTGTINGTLSDGTELNHYFQISDWEDGDIVIVPEPATLMLFITGLGTMVIKKRRHN